MGPLVTVLCQNSQFIWKSLHGLKWMCATDVVNGLTFDFPQNDLKPRFPNEHQEIGLRKKPRHDISPPPFFFPLQVFFFWGGYFF